MPDQRIRSSQRHKVKARAKSCCEYCRSQEQFATESFCVDHIIPRAQGDKTTLINLAYACLGCNGHKYTHTHAIDPATAVVAPLFHPRQQNWHDHFAWNDDLTEIIGLTPTGRVTVITLQLNRTNVVNLRKLLLLIDQHPPK